MKTNISVITEQCSQKHLISSLLFNDCQFPENFNFKYSEEGKEDPQLHIDTHIDKVVNLNPSHINIEKTQFEIQESDEDGITRLSEKLRVAKEKYLNLKESAEKIQLEVLQVTEIHTIGNF